MIYNCVFTTAQLSAIAEIGGDIVFLIINKYLKACCQNNHKMVMQNGNED